MTSNEYDTAKSAPPEDGARKSGRRIWLAVVPAVLAGMLIGAAGVWLVTGGAVFLAALAGFVPASVPATATPAAQPTQPATATPAAQQPATLQEPTQYESGDTVAPHTPEPIGPSGDTQLSNTDSSEQVTWNTVSDPSGVTYRVEVQTKGSADSGYTLRKTVKDLHSAHYTLDRSTLWSSGGANIVSIRWRVWAVDGEGNASDKSDWSTFVMVDASEGAVAP